MTIQFRPLSDSPDKPPDGESPEPEQWLPPVSQSEAEEAVFYFLQGLLHGRFQVQRPLLLTPDTLRDLYRDPHPSLLNAVALHLDALLVELHPDISHWRMLRPAPHLLGVTLAAYNCFLPYLPDPVIAFTRALVETLPPARELADILTFHALLLRPSQALAIWPADTIRAEILQKCLNRSPLTALYYPDLYAPPPLAPLAADLLRWRRQDMVDSTPWHDRDDWLAAIAPLLSPPSLAAYLRQRWLTLPPTRHIGLNLGLLFEALRQQGHQRDFLLAFYNAYAYTNQATAYDEWGRATVYWPELMEINKLLRSNGSDNSAAVRLNQRGSEWFLKFWPLVRLVGEEGPPTEAAYRFINQDFTRALLPLIDFAAIRTTGDGLRTGPLEFVSEDVL